MDFALDSTTLIALIIVVATTALWATALLPEYLTALLFFSAVVVTKVVPPSIVFAGFESTAFWLVLSGFVLGAAIKKVGLADRIALALETRLATSWPRMLGGIVLLTIGLAFVMPSNMSRIALLMPIVMALADRAGLAPGSKGRIALALAVGFGTYELSGSILPANVPNLVMSGAMESTYGLHLQYMPYLLLHGPVNGLLKAVVLFLCAYWLYPSKTAPLARSAAPAPLTAAEIRLAVVLAITLAFWVTDSWHGISSAWVGLVAACICLLPKIGFLSGDDFKTGVDFRACLYVAGILGLAALVGHTKIGTMAGQLLLNVLPLSPGHTAVNFGSLVGAASALNFVVTANGVPALFTPMAQSLADASGLPLLTVLMSQVIAYSTPLFPYQAAPLVVAMSLGGVPIREGIRLSIVLWVVTMLVLVPLDYLWFAALGYFG
jgi:anion transporter